ncbi:MAG: ABC transporter permease [Candidatus Moranbacteria bacterium]|nr:ABC transporter permease [Candidatus Moranbacteria bacterium]MDZ4385366.1 ABC transporter permease [Candidatus Moranbacteria bacterium]
MRLLDPIKISYKNILAAKFRSFLTVLGIIIGVASVIIVMAIGASAQALILDQVSDIGSNLVGVLPGGSEEKGPPAALLGTVITTLKYEDLKAILSRSNVPDVTNGSGYVTGVATAKYQDNSFSVTYQGVSSDLPAVENINVAEGRFFMPEEETNLARVVILGADRVVDFFPNVDPIGKTLTIKNLNFTVVGVLDKKGASAFSNSDQTIFVPLFTAQKLLLGIDYLNFIRVKANDPQNVTRAVSDIKITLRQRHSIEDPADDDFTVRDTAQALSTLTSVTDILKYFLASIAAISLLVGGVGVMNIMLVAVNQRIREIGLRKAVGARNHHITSQFLIEAVFITLVGGILGIITGIFISYLAAVIIRYLGNNWQFIITGQSVIIATSVTFIVGIVFGMYPARKASQVSPMEALRYE